MLGHLLYQFTSLLITLLIVISMVFFGMRVLPGDPAVILGGLDATEQQIQNLRRSLGLDEPLVVQYGIYLSSLAQGDLGVSWRQARPVSAILAERLPVTLLLASSAFVLFLALGLALGLASGLNPGSLADRAIRAYTTVGLSLPEFWIAFVLILLLSVKLAWFPFIGYPTEDSLPERLYFLALPALTLAIPRSAQLARLVRASLIEELSADYIRTARSKGLSKRSLRQHVARNALPGTFPLIALELGGLLTGVIIVEQVFSLPGLGLALLGSIGARDYAVVQGVAILAVIVYTGVNWLADVALVMADPRVRYQ